MTLGSAVIADRVRQWLSRRRQKREGQFFEGPAPPRRVRDQVIAFANAFPGATRLQWVEAMVDLCEGFWIDGWARGHEWAERAERKSGITPEAIADQIDPEWRERPAVELARPGDLVQDVREIEDVQRDYLTALRSKR